MQKYFHALPLFFTLRGFFRALAFPDFVGLLVGMGLEAYRKNNATEQGSENEPEDESWDFPIKRNSGENTDGVI